MKVKTKYKLKRDGFDENNDFYVGRHEIKRERAFAVFKALAEEFGYELGE